MRKAWTFTFIFGLLLGGMAALIIWYYQKSTSAEDGALVLLDRLAEADRRMRQMVAERISRPQEKSSPRFHVVTEPTDEVPSFLRRADTTVTQDLIRVKGIGPVFAERLVGAGIDSLAKLTALSAPELADILEIPDARAETILTAAKDSN
jgi:predicted flap endonuclease-1-like 5' DNA nuclease